MLPDSFALPAKFAIREQRRFMTALYAFLFVAGIAGAVNMAAEDEMLEFFTGIIAAIAGFCEIWSIWHKRLEINGEELTYLDCLGRRHVFSADKISSIGLDGYVLYDQNGKKLSGGFDMPINTPLLMKYLSERQIPIKLF